MELIEVNGTGAQGGVPSHSAHAVGGIPRGARPEIGPAAETGAQVGSIVGGEGFV